jgi:hypothetical protein
MTTANMEGIVGNERSPQKPQDLGKGSLAFACRETLIVSWPGSWSLLRVQLGWAPPYLSMKHAACDELYIFQL